MNRVLVTGMGVVVPHGNTVEDFWEGVSGGRSAVGPIQGYDATEHEVRIAAEVRTPLTTPDRVGPYRVRGRSMGLAVDAAQRCMQNAGLTLEEGADARDRAVVLACGLGSDAFERLGDSIWRSGETEVAPREDLLNRMAADSAAHAALEDYALEDVGPALAVQFGAGRLRVQASACASGSQALAEAARSIVRGETQQVLAGGTSAPVTPAMIPGFSLLKVLSHRNDDPEEASRPFDRDRDGFVMGEGAAFVVLESEESARQRGATVHAELAGWGLSCDAHRLTDPEEEGRGMEQAMVRALQSADPANVGYVNAHGTSTRMNDQIESAAIVRAFAGNKPLVSSSKSMFGHLIHTAGVAEAILCVRALEEGRVPPTLNLANPDTGHDLDYVPQTARSVDLEWALNNSFGFGGMNCSLLFRRAGR